MHLTGPGGKMGSICDDAIAQSLSPIHQSGLQESLENQINRVLI